MALVVFPVGMNASKTSTNRRAFIQSLASLSLSISSRTFALDSKNGPVEHGRLRRGFGVNCYDLFLGRFLGHNVRNTASRFADISSYSIPFVRFSVAPFWPDEWGRYSSNKKLFFDILDDVFLNAERSGVGLIPTLFWNPISISDYASESLLAWLDERSRTRAFAKAFITEVVGRYRSSTSLWAWEVANELNTYMDLPNALQWWAKVNPSRGTPRQRNPSDAPTSALVKALIVWVEQEVHRLSPSALISSGCDAPRSNAQSLEIGRKEHDSKESRRRHFLSLHPEGVEIMSVHAYPEVGSRSPLLLRDEGLVELSDFVEMARSSSKMLFVGEFGMLSSQSEKLDQKRFADLSYLLAKAGVDLAALWVFDFEMQKDSWSIKVGGPREYQLKTLLDVNEKFF